MEDATDTQILIIGAGAAGLTLAIDLARRGVAFRLIEQQPAPFHGSRGKGIQPRSQEIFEDLGVLDRLVAIGGDYPPQRDYRADRSYADSWVSEPVAPTWARCLCTHCIFLCAPSVRIDRAQGAASLESCAGV